MALAAFDLDNTLLAGDSDYLWGQFLCEQGVVDAETYRRKNRQFYEQYKRGDLNIDECLAFQLEPLARHDMDALLQWRDTFLTRGIDPIILPAGRRLIERHRNRGDDVVIITATNRFITAPIAERLGITDLLATEPELRDGRYTGRAQGVPCFQAGKVTRLNMWLREREQSLDGSWFYSDSQNDLPLLEAVDHPVAVDPDEILERTARERQWPVLTLRGGPEPKPMPEPL